MFAGEHRPGVGGQLDEQFVLLGGERHVDPSIGDLPGALIERQGAQQHPTVGPYLRLAAGAAKHRANTGHQLAKAERLDHVVVGAELQKQHPVDLLTAGRHHDDRHGRLGPKATTHLPPVQVGQPQVQQHQVGGGSGQGVGAVGHQTHVEALALQAGPQRLADGRVVLDDQQVHPVTLPRTAAALAIFVKPLPSPGPTLSIRSLR